MDPPGAVALDRDTPVPTGPWAASSYNRDQTAGGEPVDPDWLRPDGHVTSMPSMRSCSPMPTNIVSEFCAARPSPQRCSRIQESSPAVIKRTIVPKPLRLDLPGSAVALQLEPTKRSATKFRDSAAASRSPMPISVEPQQRRIGIDGDDVLPAVAVVVEQRPRAAVGGIVEAGERRDVGELLTAEVHEEMVALVTAMRDAGVLLDREETA